MVKMSSFFRSLIRISAFIHKEILEILRQTPLILTLVLGPFLILLLFGIGFQNKARSLHTLFVVQDNPALQQQVEEYASSLAPQLVYEGTLEDPDVALNALRRGGLDIVVIIPSDVIQSINNNQQAVIEIVHNEIDPYQISFIENFGKIYVNELNRGILRAAASQGQEETSDILGKVRAARSNVQDMLQAVVGGSETVSESDKQELYNDLETIGLLVQGGLNLMESLNGSLSQGERKADSGQAAAIRKSLSEISESRESLESVPAAEVNLGEGIASLEKIEKGLSNLETQLADFQSLEPYIMVAPFRSETKGVQNRSITPAGFFAPAVIILLLQHMAVTFTSLAIVRERLGGTLEVFRISPVDAFETLAGKYIGYLLSGGILAVIITATVVIILGVPILGSWVGYALVIQVLLFTSLGLGFLISMIARTEMQAVQYAMFVLLGSVFFSGFFLDLRYLWWPVRSFSWALPATYGIRLLQDIVLRGTSMNLYLFFALLGIGIVLFLICWILLRRRLSQE
jgi:ABC-2 type transport system permease protein